MQFLQCFFQAGIGEKTYMKKVGDALAHESARKFLTTSAMLPTVIAAQHRESGTMGYNVTLKKMLEAHKAISKMSLEVLSARLAKGVDRNLSLMLRQAEGADEVGKEL